MGNFQIIFSTPGIIINEEGRRQKLEGRRENCLWIVFDTALRVYKPQTILSTLVDQKVRSQVSPFKEMKKRSPDGVLPRYKAEQLCQERVSSPYPINQEKVNFSISSLPIA
ncbi:MAG: hypothetical protein F6K54_16545 [Okeania sp. SIO3B5]|uniref:hypothetical protein n=1 Tax=Okeania sp. SIO3B5 TaxID=2607811 RepID=UPI001401683E|nr:hypothetical protein [Okeania sp. SIO3B5]NEO54550.1 hypothetical protein [Okeania sp. SIO3B5]